MLSDPKSQSSTLSEKKIIIYNSRKGIINCGKCLDPVLHVPLFVVQVV